MGKQSEIDDTEIAAAVDRLYSKPAKAKKKAREDREKEEDRKIALAQRRLASPPPKLEELPLCARPGAYDRKQRKM